MNGTPDNTLEPVRLLFEMTRDDNPRLYDDLVRFKKGVKRVNRLRLLAHEGLMAQQYGAPRAEIANSADVEGSGRSGESMSVVAAARHTNQVFDAPPEGGVGP